MKGSGAVVLLAAACALVGCKELGGSDDDQPSICQVIGNSSGVSASSNPSGQFGNPTLAYDGHLESYATFGPPDAATGTISGSGSSRPAGEYVGVALTRPASGALTVNIATYLGGTPQETRQAGSVNYTPSGEQSTCPGYCIEQNGQVFFGVDTLLPFDTIEAQISISGLPAPLQVRELCVI